MKPGRRRAGRWGEVVALADILANGVAILMMLIVLSIKIQSDQAQEEINQNADITTILSRDMAKSIIFNDLPSSPPAVLHDYSSCSVTHDCNENLYPIVEIYDDYIRLKNENVRVTLNELLKRPNPVDYWLRAFSGAEKANLRMDIYGVGAYYLALSILTENGIYHPRHWHFLTKPTGDGKGGMSSEEFIAKYEDSSALGDKGGFNGSGDGAAGQDGEGEESGDGEEELPFSPESLGDMTMIEGGSFSELSEQGMLGGKGTSKGKPGEQGEGESEMEIKSRMSEGNFSQVGIKMPNMPMSLMAAQEGAEGKIPLTTREFMIFTALFLLHYGHELEGLQVPYLQDTLQDLFDRPRTIRRNSNAPYIFDITDQLDVMLAEQEGWPEHFANETVSDINQVGLIGESVQFVNDFVYQSMNDKPIKTEGLSILLRPWPSAYQGERSEITDSIVLAHPRFSEENSNGLRWMPLAFLTPVKDTLNVNLGFVMAEFKAGKLFIPAEQNQIWTDSGALRPQRTDVDVQPSILRLFYIYFPIALLSALALIWWFIKVWRAHRRTDDPAPAQ